MTTWPDDWFQQFWSNYPRRIAKKAAWRALEKVRWSEEVQWEPFITAVKNFARSVAGNDPQYIPHPATWVNQGRWDDELPAQQGIDDYAWRAHKRAQIGVNKYQ